MLPLEFTVLLFAVPPEDTWIFSFWLITIPETRPPETRINSSPFNGNAGIVVEIVYAIKKNSCFDCYYSKNCMNTKKAAKIYRRVLAAEKTVEIKDVSKHKNTES